MIKHATAADEGDELVKAEKIGELLGVKPRTVLLMSLQGRYPKPVVISSNVKRFSMRTHNAWVAELARAAEKAGRGA